MTLAEAILQPVLSVILLLNASDKVAGLVWGIAIANLVCYAPLFFIQMRSGRKFYSREVWNYSLRLGIPLIPHYLSSVVLSSSDRIMIQKLVGDGPAGMYNLAYTISICGTMINQAVSENKRRKIRRHQKAGLSGTDRYRMHKSFRDPCGAGTHKDLRAGFLYGGYMGHAADIT